MQVKNYKRSIALQQSHLIHGENGEIQLIEAAAQIVLLVGKVRERSGASHAKKYVEVV